jgi:HK97 family phage portal protein
MASFIDRILGRAKFSDQWSASDPAFAAWLFGNEDQSSEIVTPYAVLGLSAALRAVSVVATTIASLPLKTYERDGDERVRIPSDFDNPYPGVDGMTPFAWTETLLIHLQLWRRAFLWHEARADGSAGIAYRPLNPDVISKVYRDASGQKKFDFRDSTGNVKTVGTEQITHIAGPSIDGTDGHPMIYAARAIFSAAISGDKGAQATLRRGIRLGGLITPGDNEDDFEPEEANAILESLRARAMGRENAGDMAVINRRLKLQPWTPTNVDSQWIETKQAVLGDIERLFGVPPHLLADTEKQTSWGSGVQEQNLGFARYTLRGWSDRIEQVLALRLPSEQFTEFDYKGLLQGTPSEEITLLIAQVEAGLLTVDEARALINRPPLTPEQKAEQVPPPMAPPLIVKPKLPLEKAA